MSTWIGKGTADPGDNIIVGNHSLGIGSNSPSESLEVRGNIATIPSADAYPTLQLFDYGHNNLAINFDSYYRNDWLSSNSGSNFRIYKIADTLRFSYASGVSQGSTISAWSSENNNIALVIDKNGGVAFNYIAGRNTVRGTNGQDGGGFWLTDADDPANQKSYMGRGRTSERLVGFYTAGGWKLAIPDSSGYVGIGTISPTAGLDVNPGGISDSNPNIRLRGVTSTPPSSGNDGDIQVYESGSTRRLYIKINGTWRYASLT
jgi:hypothetical protein